jgi:hypothetical protein
MTNPDADLESVCAVALRVAQIARRRWEKAGEPVEFVSKHGVSKTHPLYEGMLRAERHLLQVTVAAARRAPVGQVGTHRSPDRKANIRVLTPRPGKEAPGG